MELRLLWCLAFHPAILRIRHNWQRVYCFAKSALLTMASVGILVEYQPDDDWEDFADRLGQYFIANKMAAAEDADRRQAVLLTVCGKNNICPDEGSGYSG